ncbi:MAG: hypothetical protein HGA86_00660, partial [Anaerolineaceae bacterium]|nr:hypothetical protein [Anaerolineaceae bacterium]
MDASSKQHLKTLIDSLAERRLRVPLRLALYITDLLLASLEYIHEARDHAGAPL